MNRLLSCLIIPLTCLFFFNMATCQQANTVGIHNTETGNTGNPKSIWTTEWSSDGKYVAVGGDDSLVWIYNTTDFRLYKWFRTNSMVKGLRWHPKENLLAIANMKGVQLLDMNTGMMTTIQGLKGGGRGIGWNYTGELLGLADGYGVVRIFDKKGQLIRSIPKQDTKSYLSLDWHPSENIILTGGDEIILFDTAGHQLSMIKVREQYTGILSVKWHPSGDFFASGDYGHESEGKPTLLQFWKPDGTKLKEMKGHHQEIRNLRWSNDGKYVATAADALRIWNTTGDLLFTGAVENNLWGIAWSKDDRFIITGSFAEGKVKLWNNRAQLIRELKN
jgi:WD40 repeat protein